MPNLVETEKEFFSSLKNEFTKNDYVKLDYLFIPIGFPHKLNRFYSNNESLWFSRLKINENQKIYYFGLKSDERLGQHNEIQPRVILKFETNINKSSFRFIKDNVLILIKTSKNSDVYFKLKELFDLRYAVKDSKSKFYINIGKIGTKKLMANLMLFFNTFNFEIDCNNDALNIIDIISDKRSVNSTYNNTYLNELNFNLKFIEIKNNIYKSNLNLSEMKKLDNYLFNEDSDGNYSFSNNFDNYELTEETLEKLNKFILELSDENDYNLFLNNLVDSLSKEDIILNWQSIENTDENVIDKKLSDDYNEQLVEDDVSSKDNDLTVQEVENDAEFEEYLDNNDKTTINSGDEYKFDEKNNSEIQDIDSIDNDISYGDNFGNDSQSNESMTNSDDVFVFEIDLNHDLINEIISNINILSSEFALNTQLDEDVKSILINDLNSYVGDVMFQFETMLLNDDERELLVKRIETDILDNKINGDINLIVNYYVEQYKLNKNIIYSSKFLENYIISSEFKKLVLEYEYDKNIVENIINKVRDDIYINELYYEDIKSKFEIYFRSFKTNLKYYDELEKCKKNDFKYKILYNLTNDELNDVFNKQMDKIDKNNGSMNVEDDLIKDIENLVMDIKSKTCDYVNANLMEILIGRLKFSEEKSKNIQNEVLKQIYDNNLREFDITDEYLLELSKTI